MVDQTQVFHQAVYDLIKGIPYGEVATYRYIGEMAEALSAVILAHPTTEVAYIVGAHEAEHPFHRVVYTFIMFRNDRQKELLQSENAIDIDLGQVNYWKSPLESNETLKRVNMLSVTMKSKFKSLQEYYYFGNENHPRAFSVKNGGEKKPLLKARCQCKKCSSDRMHQ